MTIRVMTCDRCGEADKFDTYPYEDGPDCDSLLESMIRSEEWTYTADLELCPSCSEVADA